MRTFAWTFKDSVSGKKYKKKFSMPLSEWITRMDRTRKITWMGVVLHKTHPLDLWIFQEIIFSVKPEIIIEIGSYIGGTTLYFAHLFDIIGNGKIISIDNDRTRYKIKHPRITEFTGFSQSKEIIERVHNFCGKSTVLINHDGSHYTKDVLQDLNNYCDLIAPGSYFIVEDGFDAVSIDSGGEKTMIEGPFGACQQFLKTHPEFEIDSDAERLIATYCPRGYLRRKK